MAGKISDLFSTAPVAAPDYTDQSEVNQGGTSKAVTLSKTSAFLFGRPEPEVPALAGLTQAGAGTFTALSQNPNGSIHLYRTSPGAAHSLRGVYAAATGPYTFTVCVAGLFGPPSTAGHNAAFGVAIRNSATGLTIGPAVRYTGTGTRLNMSYWSNDTTLFTDAAFVFDTSVPQGCPLWVRITNDRATNRVFSLSTNGLNFVPFVASTFNDVTAENQVGVFLNPNKVSAAAEILYWKMTP